MSQTHEEPDHESTASTPSYPGIPHWVKVSGIIAIVLVLLVVIMMVVSGGSHGPGRHMPSGSAGGYASPIAHRMQQL